RRPYSLFKQPTLRRPVSLRRRVRRLVSTAAPEEPRARGTPGSRWTRGPPRLPTSRLVEGPAPRRLLRDGHGLAAGPPRRRRPPCGVCEVCSASPPVDLPFQVNRSYGRFTYPPLLAQTAPGTSDRAGHHRQWGHATCGEQARTHAAWTAGSLHRISDVKTF